MTPEIVLPDPPDNGDQTVVSYHYDALMRLRRVRIRDQGGTFDIVPVRVQEVGGGTGVALERRPEGT